MALLYRFTNTDQSVDVQYLFDAYDGHKRLVITEVRGISEQEIMLGFLFETGIQYWHDDFTTFAEQKHYNLDIYDNGEYKGRAVEGGFILSISLDDILGGTTSPEPGQHVIVPNTEQEITSIPNSGYRHNKFTVDGQDDTNNPITVLMDAAKSVVAFFTKIWTVTISNDGNGTTDPAAGAHIYDNGVTAEITAIPNENYVPDGWTVNSQSVSGNPLELLVDGAKTVLAKFKLATRLLTITKTGNGTVVPDVGEHGYDHGTEVAITATETDEDFYFEKFVEDSVDKLDNPLTVQMLANKSVEAVFLEYQTILDILGTAPVLDEGVWKFIDGYGNKISVKNQQVCTSDGIDDYLSTGVNAYDNTIFVVKGYFLKTNVNGYQGAWNLNGRLFFGIKSDSTKFGIAYGNNSTFISSNINKDTEPHTFIFSANKFWVKDINQPIDDASLLNLIVTTPNATGTGIFTTSSDIRLFSIPFGSPSPLFCEFALFAAKIGRITDNVITWSRSYKGIGGNGNYLYEEITGVLQEIANGTPALLWANKSDICEPYELTQGVTIYQSTTDSTLFKNYIDNNDLTITDYEKVGYFPAGSGMLISLTNEIVIPIDDLISPDDKKFNDILPNGNYDFADLYALVTTINLIVTKTLISISRVLIKKKIVDFRYMGKELISVCDSLGLTGVFQDTFATVTKMTFDNAKNINIEHPISAGGTPTIWGAANSGQFRLKELVENYPLTDFIMIENINDINYTFGTETDDQFMVSDINYYPDQGLTSETEARNYWTANFENIISGYTQKLGTIINIPFYAAGKNLKIDTLPSSNGTITLTINSIQYTIEVSSTDSITDIINKISDWQYGLVTDAKNIDGESVDFYYLSGVIISFTDTDTTGMAVTISDTSTAQAFKAYYFKGSNISEWGTSTKWVNSITLWAAYKGMFNYISENLPNAFTCFLIPTRFSITRSDYSTFEEYQASEGYLKYRDLVEFQLAACAYCNIKAIDLTYLDQFIFDNFATYYYDLSVHPKVAGYELWGLKIKEIW